MITTLRTMPRVDVPQTTGIGNTPAASLWLERAIRVGLAVNLLPAFLVVVVVGSAGMLLLAAARLTSDVFGYAAHHPRTSAGQDVFRP
jgi:hypothetical protein